MGSSEPRLAEVEDEVAEAPPDLAHEYRVAVHHRRYAVQLRGLEPGGATKQDEQPPRPRQRPEPASLPAVRTLPVAGQNGFR